MKLQCVEKISLDQDNLIVFMGSMNAMSMMYAWELKKLGYNVLYFVDAPVANTLSRPENHFPGINYPYPSWIVELKIPSQIFLLLFPRFFAAYCARKIRKLSNKRVVGLVLCGFFIALASYLKSLGKTVALSHGSDLSVWANKKGIKNLSESFSRQSIFKFLPAGLSTRLIKQAVFAQYDGLAASEYVVFFPQGLSDAGDEVIKSLEPYHPEVFRRYDVSFEVLRGVERDFKKPGGKLVIFSGVRFLYRTFPSGNKRESKGNDVIIQGLAQYYKRNRNIEIHFVEKGEDVAYAKELCHALELDEVVTWHKEMPFYELIKLYVRSDICFDQVGTHWMAAIGAYAMFLGKPVIANINNLVNAGIFPKENPVLSAENADEVFNALVKLEDVSFREEISNRSKAFVEKEMDCRKIIDNLFDLL
jgi:glycosyltransferase involved in cell wall biosynthesis